MKRWKIVLVVALVLVFVAGILGRHLWTSIFSTLPGTEERDRIVLVPSGSDFEQVMDSLKAAGLVDDERAFRWLAGYKKYDRKVRPGRYVIPEGTSANTLINKLRSGEQDPVRVTFNNIRNLPQLAGRVARYIEPDSAELIQAILDPATVERLGFNANTMIGLFVPNTYEFWWTTTPEAFLDRMAKEYRTFWTEERRAKAKQLGMSQSEVSTLASIVQAETGRASDAPIIAGVYLNRLRIGMPLQADPTLKYALGLDSLNRILNVDKRVDSPYNTYTHKGLPPGPINLPEARFVDAVLAAQKHEYIYFCADEDLDGGSNFARTYEQHMVNARRYQKALNARGIYR
ncbi:MAG TPA: endolytic transglycosylase MltG [Flavobacteriales bacterium]